MINNRRYFIVFFMLLVAVLSAAATNRGDVIWTIVDDGNGNQIILKGTKINRFVHIFNDNCTTFLI